jgi:hypothetical protein
MFPLPEAGRAGDGEEGPGSQVKSGLMSNCVSGEFNTKFIVIRELSGTQILNFLIKYLKKHFFAIEIRHSSGFNELAV